MRIVSRFGVGYDTVDIAACTRRGVVVGVTNGANDLSVAEHTMMLLLAVARRTIEMDASVRAGNWMIRGGPADGRTRRAHHPGDRLWPHRHPRRTACAPRSACACWCATRRSRCLASRPTAYVPVTDVAAALPEVDVLTLHCPLAEDTRHMINREMLGLMKPTAWLINAARGPLVDEEALVEALSSGRLQAAGLDVQLREPPDPANPLLNLKNVVLEPPQCGGAGGVLREDVDPRGEEYRRGIRWHSRSRLRGEPGGAAEPP